MIYLQTKQNIVGTAVLPPFTCNNMLRFNVYVYSHWGPNCEQCEAQTRQKRHSSAVCWENWSSGRGSGCRDWRSSLLRWEGWVGRELVCGWCSSHGATSLLPQHSNHNLHNLTVTSRGKSWNLSWGALNAACEVSPLHCAFHGHVSFLPLVPDESWEIAILSDWDIAFQPLHTWLLFISCIRNYSLML